MSERNEGEGCSVSFTSIFLVIALALFIIGPERCSCARYVGDKASEWKNYIGYQTEPWQRDTTWMYAGDPTELMERQSDSIETKNFSEHGDK